MASAGGHMFWGGAGFGERSGAREERGLAATLLLVLLLLCAEMASRRYCIVQVAPTEQVSQGLERLYVTGFLRKKTRI